MLRDGIDQYHELLTDDLAGESQRQLDAQLALTGQRRHRPAQPSDNVGEQLQILDPRHRPSQLEFPHR